MDAKREALSLHARLVVEAIELEMEPEYGDRTSAFLTSSLVALTRGEVLVGSLRRELCRGERAPLVAAFPDGRLTIAGREVRADLEGIEFGIDLVMRRGYTWWMPIVLPSPSTYDLAVCWYSLVGWQVADMIARRGEGCSDCRGACVLPVDVAAAGRIWVPCGCVEEALPDEDEVLVDEDEESAFAGSMVTA